LIPAAIVLTGFLQAQETILNVKASQFVYYTEDVADAAQWSASAGPVTRKAVGNFARHLFICDIVDVNGTPVKGTVVGRVQSTSLRPAPTGMTGVADISRNNLSEFQMEILQEDGTEVGSLVLTGFGGVTPGVGSPVGGLVGSFAVTGGTGSFVGARGQGAVVDYAPRNTSFTENPVQRRVHPGAGAWSILIRLIPYERPEVMTLAGGAAAVFHADFTPVTAQNPALAGEQLIASVTGLGAVKPALDAGTPFPESEGGALHVVNAPVTVTVDGKQARVLNKVGWPRLVNVYRVDFEMPAGIGPGMVGVELSAAWIRGPETRMAAGVGR